LGIKSFHNAAYFNDEYSNNAGESKQSFLHMGIIMRIVSLLPSATEIICSLGFAESLVGVSHECDYPAEVLELPKVTTSLIPEAASSREIDTLVREKLKTSKALYSLNQAVLEKLKPDLIITQALCDVCAVAEEEVRAVVSKLPGTPQVINLAPMTLAQVFESMLQVGRAVGKEEHANFVVKAHQKRVDEVVLRSKQMVKNPRLVFLEWLDPPFSSGHWTPELIAMAGGVELLGKPGVPSRTLSWREVADAQPEMLFIAACGFAVERTKQDLPVLEKVMMQKEFASLKPDKVFVADGSQYFNRPGPRLVDSLEILAHAIDPIVHPLPTYLQPAKKVN
jgi:iron complex transport system substrate-binding protein